MDGERPGLTIRALSAADETRLVRMDQKITGRNRAVWYANRLKRALAEADIRLSIGAETDGLLVAALLGSVQYGEFGPPEPVAVLDTLLVDPDYRGRGIGAALFAQLLRNLRALAIPRLRTEIRWDEHELASFLGRQGFAPAPRLVLELDVAGAAGQADARETAQA